MSDIKNQALFYIAFKDGSKFIGGDSYFDTKWLEIPLKPIARILYRLPSGDYLCLIGYEKYFHMVEALRDWMKISKAQTKELNKKPKLQYAYIMGKKKDKIVSYRITLKQGKPGKDKFRRNDITVREYNIEDSKIKKLNPDNWR